MKENHGMEERGFSEKYTFVSLSFIVFLFSVVAFRHIGEKSLWLDEGFSVSFASMNWKDLWRIISKYEVNQCIYYFLLKIWITIGRDEGIIRSLSVVFSIGSILVVYFIGSRLFDSMTGLCSALIIAVNPFFIEYSQEARGYSLLVMLVLISSYAFYKTIEHPSIKNIAIYVIFSSLAVYAHLFAVLALAAHGVSLLFLKAKDAHWGRFIIAYLAIGIFIYPLVAFVFFRDNGQIDWISKINIKDIYYFFKEISGGRRDLLVFYFIACLAFSYWALSSFRESRRSKITWRYAFLLCCLVVPVVAVIAVSMAYKPIFQQRYLIFVLPFLALTAGNGVSRLNNKYILMSILLLFVSVSVYSVFAVYYPKPKEDWRGATNYLVEESKPGDALILYPPWILPSFNYYRRLSKAPENFVDLIYPSREFDNLDVCYPDTIPKYETSAFSGYRRVWMVVSPDYAPKEDLTGVIYDSFGERFRLEAERKYHGVKVFRFGNR